jgi:hypothetical protein
MAVKIRQEINILTTLLTAAGGVSGTSNEIVQLDTTQYVNPTYYFEIVGDSTISISFNVTLRRKGTSTDDATANIPLLTTAYKRVRSASFTPPAGQTEYVVFIDATAGATKNVKSARIIVIDNPTTLTSSETQIEIGMTKTGLTSTTATKVVPDTTLTKYWKADTTLWDGTITYYAEVTYLMASSKSSGTFVLQEDNGSFASWTDKVTIVNAGVASVATRVRSASFTPTNGRNYRIAYLVASSKSAATIYNAKIIVDQAAIADSYASSNRSSDQPISNTTALKGMGQSFTGNGAVLSATAFFVFKTGSPTGNVFMKVYADGGTFGTSSKPTGAALATSDAIAASAFPTSQAMLNFTFSGANQVTLANGTKYVLTMEYSTGGDSSNNVSVAFDNTSPTHSGNDSSYDGVSWSSFSTEDLPFYVIAGSLTLLEPQYLLLNTADDNTTNNQNYMTLWDSTEWSGVTNTYKHAIDSDNASNSADLVDVDNSSTTVTNSSLTGANQQISSAMTMPTTGHQIDTDMDNTTGVIGASRILVASTVVTSSDSNVSVSDSIVITESVTKMVEAFVSKSDSVSLSESNSQTLVSNLSVSDTEAITDSVLRRLDSNPSVSDSETITEAQSLLIPVLFASVSDSIAATDNVIANPISFINTSDTEGVTDSVQLSVTDNVSVSDSLAITDSVTVRADTNPSMSDSLTITESQNFLIPTLFITTSDSVSLTEAVLLTEPESIGISDSLSITDSVSLLIPTLFISTSDSIAITESITMMEQSFISKSDSIAITDAVILSPTSFISTSDSEVITDSVTVRSDTNPSVSDSEGITDAVTTPSVSYQVNKSDSVSLSESVVVSLPSGSDLNISVSDTEAITDSVTVSETTSVSVSNSLVITDSTTELVTSFISVSDSLSLSESIKLLDEVNARVSDSLSITETNTQLIPTLFISVNDSLSISESISLLDTDRIAVSDTEAITDSVSVSIAATAADTVSVSDNLTITDSVSLNISPLFLVTSDTLAITDNVNLSASELIKPWRLLRGPRGTRGPRTNGYLKYETRF